jgi:hypothetical protein
MFLLKLGLILISITQLFGQSPKRSEPDSPFYFSFSDTRFSKDVTSSDIEPEDSTKGYLVDTTESNDLKTDAFFGSLSSKSEVSSFFLNSHQMSKFEIK